MNSAPLLENGDQIELLLVEVGTELVAIPIESVREVIEFSPITQVPMCPSDIAGVINVRGSVVPVIDAANLLHVERLSDYDKYSCILLYESYEQYSDEPITLGLAVSRVRSIEAISRRCLLEKPPFGTHIPSQFIDQIVEFEKIPIPILMMTELLNCKELNRNLLRHQRALFAKWEP